MDKFQEFLNHLIDDTDNIANYFPKYPLFHYAPLESGKNILASRKLFFNERKDLDDFKEIVVPLKTMLDMIGKKQPQLRRLLDEIYSNKGKKFSLRCWYILSFSKVSDHPNLWRNYGNGKSVNKMASYEGTGLSVGFNPDFFRPVGLENGQHPSVFMDVLYDSTSFKSYIKKFLDIASKYTDVNELSNDQEFKLNMVLLSLFILHAPGLVDKDFIDENESRLCAYELMGPNKKAFPVDLSSFKEKDEQGRDRLVMKFGDDKISEIWIGPKCQLTELNVRDLLKTYGYDPEIINKIKIQKSTKVI